VAVVVLLPPPMVLVVLLLLLLTISLSWTQGKHTTTKGYVDTMDFAIAIEPAGGCRIRAFNVADIHGALGDSGQSYFSLLFMLDKIDPSAKAPTIVHGCGKDGPNY